MKDKSFIDTNIIVYTFDQDNLKKQERARDIIQSALQNNDGCLSNQVIQEFINVATRKFVKPLSIDDCKKFVDQVMAPLCQVYSSIELYHRALDIMQRWDFSFYDSLIIAAAVQAECTVLYTEDIQHLQKILSLTIVNPFLE